MICSVFNAKSGLYDYFETAQNVPFNADLPIPKMPAEAGKIGVAAVDAGRPLPSDANYIGSGWTAKGIVAHRGAQGIAGLDEVLASPTGKMVGDAFLSGLVGVGGYAALSKTAGMKEFKLPAAVVAGALAFVYLRKRG
jgi:hypothetical protein